MKADKSLIKKAMERRSFILGGLQALGFGILASRLYYLQIVKSEHYGVLSDKNRIQFRIISPPRGKILDRYDIALANNNKTYSILMEEVSEETLATLKEIQPNATKLNWEQIARISALTPDLGGITINRGFSRNYPMAAAAAHVVGYVGSQERATTIKIGKTGIENKFENVLGGKFGSQKIEVNALGRKVRNLENIPPQMGGEIALNLDGELQKAAHKLFKGKMGAAVITDVNSGEILLCYSSPSFDPNLVGSQKLTPQEWQKLANDPKKPFLNRALNGLYAPGSLFKPIVALAALKKGAIKPDQTFYCGGHMDYGDRRFHCWKKQGHGKMNLANAIKHSCDVYFYKLSTRVGIDHIHKQASEMGFGEKINVWPLMGKGGIMPSRKWKKQRLEQSWLVSDTMITAIGQGSVLASPIQMALAAAWFANGGTRIYPHILKEDKHLMPEPKALSKHLKLVQTAMANSVNAAGGTAFSGRIKEKPYQMAGKTGTSQVRSIGLEERETGVLKNEELPLEQRDHALFMGYAPVKKPKYAITVVLEHGGSSSNAVPIASKLLLLAQKRGLKNPPPSNSKV